MRKLYIKYTVIALYVIAAILLFWTTLTFFYQYIAAIGSLKEVIIAFKNDRILSALWLSILSSFVTVFLGIFLGIPLAYVFALKKFKGKSFLETLCVEVPQTFPPVAEGMIYLLMLGKNSLIHVNLAFTFSALVIAKLYVSTPFVVSYTARKFREIKQTGMNMTARSLGATPSQVFFYIFIPNSLKDIAAGASLCWSRAMGELGGSWIFAGVIAYKTEIIPTFIATEAHTLTIPALVATILVTTASTLALVSFKTFTKQ
jgi:molybdate transport system permease protein